MAEYQVAPGKSGWNWQLQEGSKTLERGDGYETRSDAINAAGEHRGDQQLSYADGTPADIRRGGPERVVLLRADGSLVGELSHRIAEGGAAQQVDVEPAGEATNSGGN
jgi:hypothetical protein